LRKKKSNLIIIVKDKNFLKNKSLNLKKKVSKTNKGDEAMISTNYIKKNKNKREKNFLEST